MVKRRRAVPGFGVVALRVASLREGALLLVGYAVVLPTSVNFS